MAWRWVPVAAALLLLPGAAAVEEAAAGALWASMGHPGGVSVGHEPDVVAPLSQWQGFLIVDAAAGVSNASYQICRVGEACFAPPTASSPVPMGNQTAWRFDTADYIDPVYGEPIGYEAGWRLGVLWHVDRMLANGTRVEFEFPHGEDLGSDVCKADYVACSETHYFSFNVAAGEREASLAAWLAVAAIAIAVAARRR